MCMYVHACESYIRFWHRYLQVTAIMSTVTVTVVEVGMDMDQVSFGDKKIMIFTFVVVSRLIWEFF